MTVRHERRYALAAIRRLTGQMLAAEFDGDTAMAQRCEWLIGSRRADLLARALEQPPACPWITGDLDDTQPVAHDDRSAMQEPKTRVALEAVGALEERRGGPLEPRKHLDHGQLLNMHSRKNHYPKPAG